MNSTVRNVIAVVVGFVVGSLANMAIVTIGPSIIPNPVGFDNSSVEVMKETFHLLEPIHFIVPWLAHALGALVGSFVAVKIAVSHHLRVGLVVGFLFLLGGAYMIFSLPSTPVWFSILDLIGAYIPMAWLGHKIASK